MAERARGTYDYMRRFAGEFADLELPVMVKLGYPVDGGGGGQEHLWFTVHETFDDEVEATLENEPFNIADMNAGDRGRHSIGRLTDWVIFTPAGPITPRATGMARAIRENADALRAAMREAQSEPDEPAPE
jgi:hypothetical protein